MRGCFGGFICSVLFAAQAGVCVEEEAPSVASPGTLDALVESGEARQREQDTLLEELRRDADTVQG